MKKCEGSGNAQIIMMNQRDTMMLVAAAAASGIGATITARAIQSCNAVSYRLTMQLIAVAVGLALTAISMGPIGKRFLSNPPTKLLCSDSKAVKLCVLASIAFGISGVLYMIVLKRSGDTGAVGAILAPSALVFTALIGVMLGDTVITPKVALGIGLAVTAVYLLS